MTEKITLIIPLRLTAGTFEGELRLKRLCAIVPRDLFDILISDYGTEDAHFGPIAALAGDGVEVVRHPSPERLFSIGRCRDFGVQMARRKVVLFNDIDFFGTANMYRRIHAEAIRRNIADNLFDFFCVPVLFLTEGGTAAWFAAEAATKPFVERFDVDWLDDHAPDIQFTAFGSSAIVVNRHHYLSLGGHDRRFRGHGAEDYDILHRLSSLAPLAPRPHDYYTDYKTNAVRQYWGFRPFFALYGLDAFSREVHLVHLWHPRRQEKGYFRPRPNFALLRRLMRSWDDRGNQPEPLADLLKSECWLVLSTSARVPMTLQQVMPLAGAYTMLRYRALPPIDAIVKAALDCGAGLVVVPDDCAIDIPLLEQALLDAGLGCLAIRADAPPGQLRWTLVRARPMAQIDRYEAVATRFVSKSPRGREIFMSWDGVVLGGEISLSTGTIPTPVPADENRLLASFGGAAALNQSTNARPRPQKKSSMLRKLMRRIRGL